MPDDVKPSFARTFARTGPAGILALAWSIVPGVLGLLLLAKIGPVSDWIHDHHDLGLALYIAVFAVSSGCGLLPTYAQSVLGGWVFGIAEGVPAALAGYCGGAVIGYMISRAASHERVEHIIAENRKARAVRDALIGRGFWPTAGIVALVRIPSTPFSITNLILAAAGVRWWPFIVGSLIGMAPRTAIAVTVAAFASREHHDLQAFVKEGDHRTKVLFYVGIAATVIVLGIISYIGNKAVEKVTASMAKKSGDAESAG